MKEEDMVEIADLINLTITDYENSKEKVKERVRMLCEKYPLYQ